jgi:hypothetical protein
MKVYHGSYTEIRTIDFAFCRKKRDFGRGFYVTKLREQAEYWATRKGEDNDTEGVVTEFEFHEYFFDDEDLKVLRFDNYNEEWLDFIVQNRLNTGEKQKHDYDIVEGPVADDDIATRVYSYIKGKISKKQFLEELTLKKPTHQICFCTMQSLQALEYIDSNVEWNTGQIAEKVIKQMITDGNMDEMKATDLFYTSKTFVRLANESTKLYEKHWTEIYEMLKQELQYND